MRTRLYTSKNQDGQSLVEFALVVPILLLLLIGIIEFAWMFNAQITLTSAAREGARRAAVAQVTGDKLTEIDKDRIRGAIQDHLQGLSGLILPDKGSADTTDKYFEVQYDGLITTVGEIPDVTGADKAHVVVVLVPKAGGGFEEVRVFIKGNKQWLTGLFGFMGESLQLGAEAFMRKE